MGKKNQLCQTRLLLTTPEAALTLRKCSTSESDGPHAEKRKPLKKTGQVGRAQRSYPVDQERRRFKTTGAGKSYRAAQKVKEGIVPGSVLILVAGRRRGKRVVFLKQLESGLLLVTGPFKINGVPLRRVNQKYVIATSTKLNVNKVKIPERVNDEYFSRVELNQGDHKEGEIFQTKKQVYSASSERKEDQKAVDSAIVAAAK